MLAYSSFRTTKSLIHSFPLHFQAACSWDIVFGDSKNTPTSYSIQFPTDNVQLKLQFKMALFRIHLLSSTHQILSSPPLPFHKPSLPKSIHFVPSLFVTVPGKSVKVYRCQRVFLSVKVQPTTQTIVLEENVQEELREEDEFSKTRLVAQNIPWTCTVDDLRPLFEKYGAVLDIEIPKYNKNRNRGLAFVTMGSHEEALAALTNLESYEYQGRVIKVNWAKTKKIKPDNPPPTPTPMPTPTPRPVHNLFVANFPFKTRAKDLKEFFNAGNDNVVSAEVIFQENPRRPAGYGFVTFKTKDDAEAAVLAFQGKEFMGRPITVALSKSFLKQDTKEEAIESDNASALSKSGD